MLLDHLVCSEHGFSLLIVLLLLRRSLLFILFHFDMVLLCQIPNGIREIVAHFLSYKGDSVTAFATTKAVPITTAFTYMERWSLFLVQRTTTDIIRACLANVGKLLYNFAHRHLRAHCFNSRLGNHSYSDNSKSNSFRGLPSLLYAVPSECRYTSLRRMSIWPTPPTTSRLV